MRITRTTNKNGSYRYEIDGELHIEASKVLYTHASSWTYDGHGPRDMVMMHKSASAAQKATGYAKSWVKTGVIEIDAA